MALLDDLTEEQKKELEQLTAAEADKKLQALGYDQHARDVIARANAEAKKHREEKEELAARLKPLEDAEKARKAEQDRKDAEEAERKKNEAPLAEKVAAVETSTKSEVDKLREEINRKDEENKAALKKRDERLVLEALRNEAVKLGVIDPDDVKYPDYSKIPVEDGVVDRAAVEALAKEWSEKKPNLFKQKEEPTTERDPNTGRFVTRPASSNGTSKDVDAAALFEKDPGAFAKMTERFRTGTA